MLYFKKRGFTLVELMVAISIIAILSSIVVAALTSAKANSRDAKRITDIRNIQVALAQYYNDNNFYPSNIYNTYNASDGVNPTLDGLKGVYLAVVPNDPSTGQPYFYSYYYTTANATCNLSKPPVYYHLGAKLESAGNSVLDNGGGSDAFVPSGSYTINGVPLYPCQGAADFQGESPDCGSSVGTDQCFDVIP